MSNINPAPGVEPANGPGLSGDAPRHADARRTGALGAIGSYLARFDDGEVLRWAFRGLLVGSIAVLVMDYLELNRVEPAAEIVAPVETRVPILPPAVDGDTPAGGVDPRPFLKTDEAILKRTMQFTLGAGGVLAAEGSIEPGTAARLAAELQARGEYVKTISLNSPGGALDDAMEMGRLARTHDVTTLVAEGSLCASSCPLILAGGKQRLVSEKSGVGVHQFYAVASPGDQPVAAAQAMSDAQSTTARITRYLEEMDVDPASWLHAMDTPPQSLYYFSPDELKRYRLATGAVTGLSDGARPATD